MQNKQILVLGPESSGKTLLFKLLNHYHSHKEQVWNVGDIPPHIPTVGTNICTVEVRRGRQAKRFDLRELGGAMGPIWSSYYHECQAIIYVVDSANPILLSAAAVLLFDMLRATQETRTPVLIVFSKCDSSEVPAETIKRLMLLDDLMESPSGDRITVVDAFSALDGRGAQAVTQWLLSLS